MRRPFRTVADHLTRNCYRGRVSRPGICWKKKNFLLFFVRVYRENNVTTHYKSVRLQRWSKKFGGNGSSISSRRVSPRNNRILPSWQGKKNVFTVKRNYARNYLNCNWIINSNRITSRERIEIEFSDNGVIGTFSVLNEIKTTTRIMYIWNTRRVICRCTWLVLETAFGGWFTQQLARVISDRYGFFSEIKRNHKIVVYPR